MAARDTDVLLRNTATSSVPGGVFTVRQEVPQQTAGPVRVQGSPHQSRSPTEKLKIQRFKAPPPPPPGSDISSDEDGNMASDKINSMFFSSSTSESGDEHISEIKITDVYVDPLDACMEMIEDLSTAILRTGKLKITGEPGDMSKVQPALFGLQSTDRELQCLLLQLLQAPFFVQSDQDIHPTWEPTSSPYSPEDFLLHAHIRLGLPVDTAIYHLLRGHCCKGARQAEELIKTALSTSYNSYFDSLATPQACVPQMPPIIFFSALGRRAHPRPLLSSDNNGFVQFVKVKGGENGAASVTENGDDSSVFKRADSGVSSLGPADESTAPTDLLRRPTHTLDKSQSNSSVSTVDPHSSRGSSIASILSGSNASSSSLLHAEPPIPEEPSSPSQTTPTTKPPGGDQDATAEKTTNPPPLKTHSGGRSRSSRQRRTGEARHPFDRTTSSTSDVSGDEGIFSGSERRSGHGWHPENNIWHTTMVDNSVIMGMYGDNTYPLMMWDPSLKVEFKLSSSVGLISSTVTGIDPSKPTVTMKVANSTPNRVAFSVRVYRLSSMIKYHVAYPSEGLHVLEPYMCWEDNAEFYARVPDKSEYFVIDLFLCTLGSGHPSWNVQRKYAAMGRAAKSPGQNGSHQRKPRPSAYQTPGSMQQRVDNLQLVVSHGLQCVVKNKVEEAETILTQALYLPDFQRLSLKAFVYICLAVLANKRRKAGHLNTLLPLLTHENSATRLVHVCESPPGVVKMPRTLQLVKQLKKELNLPDIMKKMQHKRGGRSMKMEDKSKEEDEEVGSLGGTLSINCTLVTVPPGALPSNTRVRLSKPDTHQLHSALQAAGWEKTVSIVTALHIECSPSIEHFRKPVDISCTLAEEPKRGALSFVRLQHSNYLRQWKDITDDTNSKVSVLGKQVQVSTDRLGWIAVAIVQLDASMITQMAMGALAREPIMLKLNVYGQVFAEGSIQVAVFVVPCRTNEEPIHTDTDLEKPPNHVPIAFPHTIQAWPGETLRLELHGCFEPDTTAGERDLSHEFEVQDSYNQILEKWIRLTSQAHEPLTGKLVVSAQRAGKWKRTSEINLSNRNAS